ncbi:thymidine phosphorylase [Geminicoccus roseus]|uniref:thymidine phosphorylase n=1 Tax=Geminicoccus roseus TaxID=404900 RepID=UPI0004229594|nr:thymidine phosphorylase [Geminicoccus roseus]
MLAQEIIRTKRDGGQLSEAAIRAFVQGLCDGSWSEGQVAALAMAILLRGMEPAETVALTRAMAASGERLDWDGLPGPVVDKHSTGGIGDKVSLILAPLLAACGCFVPMLSGRGLGHTGGTLDKLDSIEGYRTSVPPEQFRHAVRAAGCAIVGQTEDLAPADRRLYAIRDVTATVESVPLITASILSKKLAAGPHGLVMDVKYGSGAFLPDQADARALALSLVEVATGAGLPCRALLTDMSMCLGTAAGNAVEVREAIDVLTGQVATGRLLDLTLGLAAELLDLAGIDDGRQRAETMLSNGQAAERFARMVTLLGGPPDLLERPDLRLPSAPVQRPAFSACEGFVAGIDARGLGIAIIELGGGRRRPQDRVDHAVGLTGVLEVGSPVGRNTPLAMIHARDDEGATAAEAALRQAFRIERGRPSPRPLIAERLGARTKFS